VRRSEPHLVWNDVLERFVARLCVATVVVLALLAFGAVFLAGLAI
jgi:hypothetical protein